MLLPVLAVANDNKAISSSYSTYSYSGGTSEKRINVPFAAAGVQQEAMSSTDAGANFSVGMWIKTTAVSAQTPSKAILFRMGTPNHGNNNGALNLFQSSDGSLTFYSGGDNIGETDITASMGTASLNEWHHILLTLDSENNLATVYVDGVQAGQSSAFTKFGYKWDDGVFQLLPMCWSGLFDELQFYTTALSATDAAKAYANARAVSSLATLYTFDAVKTGSTGTFASEAGSVSDTEAVWETVTYGGYWDSGLVNMSSNTEVAPTLEEGRTIVATEASVTLKETEGGVLTATVGETTYNTSATAHIIMTGTTLTINATPNTDYNLIGIYAVDGSDNKTEIANGGTYVVVGDITIEAEFTNESYSLTVDNELSVPYTLTYKGATVSDLTKLMGGNAEYKLTLNVPDNVVLESVQLGTETLTAVEGVYTIKLTGDATLKINARNKAQYAVTITQVTGGTITVKNGTTTINSGDKVLEGEVLTLSVTKESGYTFLNYVVNGTDTNDATVTVNSEVTISAKFEEGIDYCEPVSQRSGNPTTTSYSGRYISSVAVTDGTSTITLTGETTVPRTVYTDQTGTILTTEPGASLTFTSQGNGVWMNTFVYIDWDRNGFDVDDKVFDNYTGGSNSYALSNQSLGSVPTDIAGGTYRARYIVDWENSDPCKLDVDQSSDNGCYVVDFSINIPSQTLDAPRTVTVVSANETLGTVSITSPATTGTSVTTDEKIVTVKATPATNYAFMKWTKGGTVVSTSATYNCDETTDVTLTANFGGQVTYTVGIDGSATFTADGAAVSSGDVLAIGTELSGTVNPNSGKEFIVSINGTPITVTGKTFTYTVTANTTINVQFVDKICYLHYSVVGNGSIQVWTDADDGGTPKGSQLFDGDIIPANTDLHVWFIPATGKDAEGNEAKETLTQVIVQNGDDTSTLEADADYYDPYEAEEIDETAPMYGALYYPAPTADGDFTISATFTQITQGIEEIGIDPANGPVEYYNLQGVRVAADNLVPGFYIVRQGSKAVKVLIQK